MQHRAFLLHLALVFCVLGFTFGQDVSPPPIEELMATEIFELTGLHKLTDEELAALNAWLVIYAESILKVYGQSAASQPSTAAPTQSVIQSRIDGEFNGWDGSTIFPLQNGQVWQQATYAYRYHYAYMPRVTIHREGSRYLMQVEGVRDSIEVIRIR